MEFNKIIIATVAATLAALSLGVATAAPITNYVPPERIDCMLDKGKLRCEGFAHQYLVEDTYTADLDDKDQVFNFASGAAYYNTDKSQATVFFTYRNANFKNVKVKSANTTIRPDFENGAWVRVQDDLYVCKAGYMQCPITSLPAERK